MRALKPGVKVVVGGYDPSFAREAYMEMNVDYIVRGEGEITFRDDYFCVARQNEAARATDATAWVRSAVVVLIVR